MRNVEEFLARLTGVVQNSDGWRAKCPAHEDRNPSLSVAVGEDGRLLVHCHAGCSTEAICNAVGWQVSDLFTGGGAMSTKNTNGPTSALTESVAKTKPAGKARSFAALNDAGLFLSGILKSQPSAEWIYHDPSGREYLAVLRFDGANGKTYRPLRRVADSWQLGDPLGPLPLYRLPELCAAPRVFVTEGEKAAEAARSIGLVATTSAHGAKSPHKTDWSPLAGKEVILLPDNNEAGKNYAKVVSKILAGLQPPPRVRVVELPDLPTGGDLVDFLDRHDATEPDALRQLVEHEVELAVAESKPVSLLPARREPFPTHVLPEPLRSFVEVTSTAMDCDAAFIALPLLSVCAAAIGNSRRIRLKRGWSEPAILWTAVIAGSGTLKTPAFKLIMNAMYDQQAEALEVYESDRLQYEQAQLEFDRDLATWKRGKTSGPPPVRPMPPAATRYVVSDTTVEALAPLLLANPRGLLLARDELVGWIGSFDRYAQGKGADAAHWLSMHNGETLIVDRKTGQPRTIFVPRAAVSMTGGIQPRVLARSLGPENRENRLAARLLLTWPERQIKCWNDNEIETYWENVLRTVIQNLLKLEPLNSAGKWEPKYLPLSPDAKRAWVEFYNQHAREQADLDEELSAAWSKLEGYAARLALIVYLVRTTSGDVPDHDEIDIASIEAGIALSRWFGLEAKRVYAMLNETEDEESLRTQVEWIRRHGGQVTVRQTQQAFRQFTTAGAARMALDRLVEVGLGRWHCPKSSRQGGRPSEVFALLDAAAIPTQSA